MHVWNRTVCVYLKVLDRIFLFFLIDCSVLSTARRTIYPEQRWRRHKQRAAKNEISYPGAPLYVFLFATPLSSKLCFFASSDALFVHWKNWRNRISTFNTDTPHVWNVFNKTWSIPHIRSYMKYIATNKPFQLRLITCTIIIIIIIYSYWKKKCQEAHMTASSSFQSSWRHWHKPTPNARTRG